MARTGKKKVPEVSTAVFDEPSEIGLAYQPSPRELAGAVDDKDAIVRLLRGLDRVRPSEQAARRTLVGPQRDEVEIRLLSRPAARFASAGEQRRIAFILLVAAFEVAAEAGGGARVLLVDDVETELDDRRLDRAMEFIAGRGQAVVATSKQDVARRHAARASILSVERGRFLDG